MFNKIADIFKIPQLRSKVLFTLAIIVAYRIGAAVPIPGINADAVRSLFEANSNGLLGFLDMFSGGALNRMSVFSMGIMPYINASIIMSLMQGAHVIPYLDRLAKEGEQGRKKLTQITRYGTLILGAIQSFGLTMAIMRMPTPSGMPIVLDPTMSWMVMTVFTLVTGTVLIMWLGEQVTERGIGNGISLIIFAGIVERLPSACLGVIKLIQMEELSLLLAIVLLALVLVVLTLVVWVETAQRRIPINYAKRMVGRRMYGGQTSFLPIKVDQSGVIAVIFAVSILSAPLTIAQFAPDWTVWGIPVSKTITDWFNRSSWVYNLVYAGLVIFFCYFYNSISFNPKDLAENMKKSGGFVPGIRPGEPTAVYIQKVLERVTLGGALFVACIAVLPDYLRTMMSAPFFFGGTSLLIVVGVSLDTIGQIESHLIMRHYEGFMKEGRIKGRWFNIK
ncbi:preprotein translocase subunit SecY [Candidatus Ruminimicrobiellum ovillum]|jgi:preprotein translocase subunit SecY|uniref:preprotein translocase subunit SecY n=1 Tax=Candidatus Ruminimicrobiellum ovillum TaxID=1947927 RepID=UPI001B06F66F|nr:preprotein translocase subunit SecY [Elusimicrobiota bacterium]MBQ2219878.1 preprotein translocase subunit SecY [Elusimicrobiota bacterium]